MSHALVIAAIFSSYLVLMLGLGTWIYRTGHPREDDPPDTREDDRTVIPAAA